MNTHNSLKKIGLNQQYIIQVSTMDNCTGTSDCRANSPVAASSQSKEGAAKVPAVLIFEGVPRLNLTRRQLELVFGSPRLVQRIKHHRWIVPLNPNSSDQLFPVSRVLNIQVRLESGEMPPPLPSEKSLLQEDSL